METEGKFIPGLGSVHIFLSLQRASLLCGVRANITVVAGVDKVTQCVGGEGQVKSSHEIVGSPNVHLFPHGAGSLHIPLQTVQAGQGPGGARP